jgi:hypothetical protein
MNDKELNEIIDAPKVFEARMDSNDVSMYFSASGKTPSWKFMCKERMKYLFTKYRSSGLASENHKNLIDKALLEL